jgi:hypothetical protein
VDLVQGKRLAFSFDSLCTFSLPSNFATHIMASLLHPLSITLIANCLQWRLVTGKSAVSIFEGCQFYIVCYSSRTLFECSSEVLCASVLVKCFVRVFY